MSSTLAPALRPPLVFSTPLDGGQRSVRDDSDPSARATDQSLRMLEALILVFMDTVEPPVQRRRADVANGGDVDGGKEGDNGRFGRRAWCAQVREGGVHAPAVSYCGSRGITGLLTSAQRRLPSAAVVCPQNRCNVHWAGRPSAQTARVCRYDASVSSHVRCSEASRSSDLSSVDLVAVTAPACGTCASVRIWSTSSRADN